MWAFLELALSRSVLCVLAEEMTGPGKTIASQQIGGVCLLFKQILMIGNYSCSPPFDSPTELA